jgi:hypothetical protein
MRSTQEATRLLATVRDRLPAVTYAPIGSALYGPFWVATVSSVLCANGVQNGKFYAFVQAKLTGLAL